MKSSEAVDYLSSESTHPLFLCGDARELLATLPNQSIDCCITSPPYWGQRQYASGGIGLEATYSEYIENLLAIFYEVKRTLKPSGSFWLNMGDKYFRKNLLGLPWRTAFALQDRQGWILRNDVIWNKHKGGPDSSKDRLRNVHEHLFHFVLDAQKYYYNDEAIRSSARRSKIKNGAVVSGTGVTGIRYKRQIELTTALTEDEKREAQKALENVLAKVQVGEISDFRMIIRNQQRVTHSNAKQVSGRAREIHEKGFYFLCYNPNGPLPSDVWDILPEDAQNRKLHFAPFPEDLCRIPLLATCPLRGIVLDPFCGTGTAMVLAQARGLKSIGIDISQDYISQAKDRVNAQQSLGIF